MIFPQNLGGDWLRGLPPQKPTVRKSLTFGEIQATYQVCGVNLSLCYTWYHTKPKSLHSREAGFTRNALKRVTMIYLSY